MFDTSDLIHAYTRADALADGVLIDAGPLARELGFKVPVALTAAAWNECVGVPADAAGQDERGRLWDVLWPMHIGVRKAAPGVRQVHFDVRLRGRRVCRRVRLKAVCGPADDGGPCVTVMLPDES